ncbi:MAG: hypothetical protein ACKN82_16525, partial [Pirellula sp.]
HDGPTWIAGNCNSTRFDRCFVEWVACGSCRNELARIDLADCSCVCDCASVDDLVPRPRTIGNYQTSHNETRFHDRSITTRCKGLAGIVVGESLPMGREPLIGNVMSYMQLS